MKFILFLILNLQLININAQTIEEVDKKIADSYQAFVNVQLLESLIKSKEALTISKKINYSEGIIKSNIYIAKVLIEIAQYSEALEFIKDAEQTSSFKKSKPFIVESHRLKGMIYTYMNLYDNAEIEFRDELYFSKKLKNPLQRNLSLLWSYQNLSFLYEEQKKIDSTFINLSKAQNILKELDLEKNSITYVSLYNQLGRIFLLKNKLDSSVIYLNKSEELIKKYKIPYTYSTDQIYGEYFIKIGDSIKAIFHYEKALKNTIDLNIPKESQELHYTLASLYKKNNIEKYTQHYNQFTELKNTYDNNNAVLSSKVLEYLIDSEKDKIKHQKDIYTYIGIIILLLGIGYLLFNLRRVKLYKIRLKNKREIISKNENIIHDLHEKIDDNSLERLFELAKKNSPEFLVLFTEVYPDFINTLKKQDSHIKNSEIIFCAMLYLNFSSKDIAEYTFVTPRAVQIRKNRLRNKYKINSNEDLNKWMRDLK